jgi:ABC-type transport system involved in cytochrome c biogenesis permease subunit
MKSLFRIFSSLWLTVALLALSIMLVFFGTLDQVHLGIHETQLRYFESFIAVWHYPMEWPFSEQLYWFRLPMPGGFALGTLLLVNLCCAHFRYFRPSWKKSGIAITHAGVALLLVSGFLVSALQEESQMAIDEGGRSNYSVSHLENELVLIDRSAPDYDEVTSIPQSLLKKEGAIPVPELGLTVNVLDFMPNAGLGTKMQNPNGPEPRANRGAAARMGLFAVEKAPDYSQNAINTTTAIVELVGPDGSLGSWLVSNVIDERFPAQTVEVNGKTYELALRFKRTYMPFWLELKDFSHDKYPGTDKARNFSSDVRILTPGESPQPALIYMNHPLRHGGYTFYQASFGNNDTTSILMVVRNPSWLVPYLAITLVGLGMCIQFLLHLTRFTRSKTVSAAARPKGPLLIPALCLLVGLLIVARGAKPPAYGSAFDVRSFAELPVQSGGRILPLDSVARNSLRLLSGRQSVRLPDGGQVSAIAWMMELSFNPIAADKMPVFRIDNPQVLGLFGWQQGERKYFSFDDLRPHFQTILDMSRQVNPEPKLRTAYERQLLKLYNALSQYDLLARELQPGGGNPDELLLEYGAWERIVAPGRQALALRDQQKPYDEESFKRFDFLAKRYVQLASTGDLGIIPPVTEEGREENDWLNLGEGLLLTLSTDQINPIVEDYGKLTVFWRQGNADAFNETLAELHAKLAPAAPDGHVAFEEFFNTFEPFYQASILYVIIFLLAAFSWLFLPRSLQRGAFWLLLLAFAVHTFGLCARMYIQERPPVTNLYSSAIFVGWFAVLLGIVLEWVYRNGIGSFSSGLIGFVTLIIAHNLALSGDTLEMMQAVLDSNFWLATHVVIITVGYSATFLAGMLAIVYVVLLCIRAARRTPPPAAGKADPAAILYRMCYGIICFALLFSFVGTMLGGIWADQSWGRFWGWDPKENGALIIVLWCALMLHARLGRLVGERGFMALAIFGNIVTVWSWFGTNMLGVGLHSYGFMDKAFVWIVFFGFTQLVLILLGLAVPARKNTLSSPAPRD